MNALIVYATRSGNTRRVAEAIADGLASISSVEVRSVDNAPRSIGDEVDLLVVGGPTEGRHVTPPMLEFLERIPDGAIRGRLGVAFDTRLDWPRFLSGSAADDIRRHLERMGARSPVRSESFIVSIEPEIRPDELARAHDWGAALAGLAAAADQATLAGAALSADAGGVSR